MGDLILYGDCERSPALRHEVPVAIGDPFLLIETDGRLHLLSTALERERMAKARPDAVLIDVDELGRRELQERGLGREEMHVEIAARMVARLGVREAMVDFNFPLGLADRLRAGGVTLTVDEAAVRLRRRVKSPDQLAGIRRATRAAEAGLAAARILFARADAGEGGVLMLDGEPLLAEHVRTAVRRACAASGCPASGELIVASVWQDHSHDPGSGPLPAGLPIQIDLWPVDEASGCFTDMTRTFVAAGEAPAEILRQEALITALRETLLTIICPGVSSEELYRVTCDAFEQAGYATARTQSGSEGFQFSLGHGVGLAVHEPPGLGRTGPLPLLAGDVLALEPGLWDSQVGGYRYEDVVLVTADGCELLSDFPYGMSVD